MYIIIGIGVVVALAILAYVLMSDRRSPVQVMEAEDGADPLKRWARGCYSIVYGKSDPGRTAKRGCIGTLAEYWEIKTADDVQQTLVELQQLPENDVAWDLMRAIIVARFAEGAELISKEQSWATISAVRPRLQQAYSNWSDLAAAYAIARQNAGFDSDMLTDARPHAEQIWHVVPFK